MKNFLHHCIYMLLLGLPALTWAQAPYNGGIGDGYDSHSFIVLKGDPPEEIPFSVSPTVFQSGDPVFVQVAEVREHLRIRVYSVDGKLIRKLVDASFVGSFARTFYLEDLATASYVLEVIADEEKFTQKLLIFPP